MATIIHYCPMCQPRPKRGSNPDPLNPKVSVPKICPACQAKNGQMLKEVIAAGKVRVFAPGKSALEKEDHQKSLLNLTRRNKSKVSQSKKQPP